MDILILMKYFLQEKYKRKDITIKQISYGNTPIVKNYYMVCYEIPNNPYDTYVTHQKIQEYNDWKLLFLRKLIINKLMNKILI